jgi:thiamine-phosphate pyrophosphorylase
MRKPEIATLQLITSDSPFYNIEQLVQKACDAGITWIQLRMKDVTKEHFLATAEKVRRITSTYNVALIINDHIDVAKQVSADGVHLGKQDESPEIARQILGDDFIIGGTANTVEEVKRLNSMGVNYIGAGPFRFTSTKKNLSPVLGHEGIKQLVQNSNVPVVAIGGILSEDVSNILRTGVHGIAIAGAINNHKDLDQKIKDFQNQLIQVVQ